jgi:hypothetical protein
MDGDDGWYVDDIRITNMLSSPVTLSDDTFTNPANACPTLVEDHCDFVDADLTCLPDEVDNDQDGTVDETCEDNCATLAPGHAFTMSAAESFAGQCVDGSLNYRFWLDTDADGTISDEPASSILYDWSDKTLYVDNPVGAQDYCVEVRCATDPLCVDHTCINAGHRTANPDARDFITGLGFLDDQKSDFAWDAFPDSDTYDTVKGDLDALIGADGDFSASSPTCLEADGTDTQSSDGANPPDVSGQGFYYIVRGSTECATYDSSGTDRDTGVGSTCP